MRVMQPSRIVGKRLNVSSAMMKPSTESPSSAEKDMLREYADATGAPVAPRGVLGKAKKIFS